MTARHENRTGPAERRRATCKRHGPPAGRADFQTDHSDDQSSSRLATLCVTPRGFGYGFDPIMPFHKTRLN
ncbi:hypothetical protein [Burkholderia ambifaria]|jgi:hypothetical protein|uniref:hypothetical protein n=1 Tax=Burkholderia ambifaria TaxID=152480 RepID=UPI0012FE149D|nr:hypothetical protein [Burkholderia ambifaria]